MTVQEIKDTYSMSDVVRQYGFTPNRGFIKCPFHSGDRTASLRVYDSSFHCFGCNANGDIFKFVQMMDNVDFRTAYLKLGGEYKAKKTLKDLYNLHSAKKNVEKRKQEEEHNVKRFKHLIRMIDILQRDKNRAIEGSDTWHYCSDHLEMAFSEIENILQKGIKK